MHRRGFLAAGAWFTGGFPRKGETIELKSTLLVEPLPLAVSLESIAQVGNYGDIVSFPEVDGEPQRGTCRDNSLPFNIDPNQKFILVRPDES